MTFKADERIFETSTTAGAGDYTLDGAQVGYQAVSAIGANNTGPFFVTDGVNWEAIIGKYITGPSRLQRTTVMKSSNGGAAVNWGAGTRQIRSGWPAWLALPRVKTKSVAGAVDVALTDDECRCDILILNGALTANINVTVDATPWNWQSVYNNTTGAFTLAFKVTALTGIVIPQGRKKLLHCDGTDVVDSATDNALVLLATAAAAASATIDFTKHIDAAYDEYLVTFTNVVPATDDAQLMARVSEDAGATFKAGATDYRWAARSIDTAAAAGAGASAGDTKMTLGNATSNNAAAGGLSGEFRMFGPATTAGNKSFRWSLAVPRTVAVNFFEQTGGGQFKLDANAINGLRFLMSAGNITSGNFALYGVRKT